MLFERCFDTKSIREIENLALLDEGIDRLMEKAGKAIFDHLSQLDNNKSVIVFCGPGNNGGDGYVTARLAKLAGLNVQVYFTHDPNELPEPALNAYKKCQNVGVSIAKFSNEKEYTADVCIDALLGIGITRDVSGVIADAVKAINLLQAYTICVDVPSGVDSNTGNILGIAVKGDVTITFIANKLGLVTGKGLNYCGLVSVASLDVPLSLYQNVAAVGQIISSVEIKKKLLPRVRDSHKGTFGNVLIIGGDEGMAGAVIMAASGALRAGAGKVTVATHPSHAMQITNDRPETIVMPVAKVDELQPLLASNDVVVFGPGMRDSSWSNMMWDGLDFTGTIILDAGGLRLLAKDQKKNNNWILTPHPGEAADLLNISNNAISQDRYHAARSIANEYGGCVVLKGAGSIVCTVDSPYYICTNGNPGMASAGMGDVLSGIIAGIAVNGLDNLISTKLGVLIHALAGDMAAASHQRGLLAMDLMPHIRKLVNPK